MAAAGDILEMVAGGVSLLLVLRFFVLLLSGCLSLRRLRDALF